ncbi:hypothetical protein SteCoe_15742 [Stentor coeruleus]|uniref:Uncharacterized protein n=1 Tax=Stentor coeruleus TaxID=5963 RepID=A0A1R2C2S8_9CILI|nr:hypothetical protein SteCoe_15742 [Stentor coeruleus]
MNKTTSKIVIHKDFGIFVSPLQWKLLIQDTKKSLYPRNLDLLSYSQTPERVVKCNETIRKSMPHSWVLKKKSSQKTNVFQVKKNNIQRNSLRVKTPGTNSLPSMNSIDKYKQLGLKNIRNYNDSEDDFDEQSISSEINQSIVSNNKDLSKIDESRCTYNSKNNISTIIKQKLTKKLLKKSQSTIPRIVFTTKKYDIKFPF